MSVHPALFLLTDAYDQLHYSWTSDKSNTATLKKYLRLNEKS